MLQVVATASFQYELMPVTLTALVGQCYLLLSVQVLCRDSVGFQHLVDGALEDHFTAFAPGFWSDVNNIV